MPLLPGVPKEWKRRLCGVEGPLETRGGPLSSGIAVSQEEGWELRGRENLSQGLLTFGNTAEGQESQEVDLNRG